LIFLRRIVYILPMAYIWQVPEWPAFHWDSDSISSRLIEVRHEQGRLLGTMSTLGFPVRRNTLLRSLTEEIQKSGEIEGELLETEALRSSVARKLGIDIGGLTAPDRHVDGVVELALDATRNYEAPLSVDRLSGWHAGLFPTGRSGIYPITVGTWRDDRNGPMRVISGSMGREKIHFQAPPADLIPDEMNRFLDWYNGATGTDASYIDPVLKSAIAHLWFVTIHPFDDGNGRMARAIADMALARADRSPDRYYSMSKEICRERSSYYEILETTQKGNLEITPWLIWYFGCLGMAISLAQNELHGVRDRADFWERAGEKTLNPRQKEMLKLMLDDFKGKMTTSKWAKLCKCSQDSAGRDVEALTASGLLRKGTSGGRSTWYELVMRK
jgi:Fic family protein